MDYLALRELCDEYFRIENDMRRTDLTMARRIDLAKERAVTIKSIDVVVQVWPSASDDNSL